MANNYDDHHLYEDVYTSVRISATGDVEVLTTDEDRQTYSRVIPTLSDDPFDIFDHYEEDSLVW